VTTSTELVPVDVDARTAEVERQVAEARAQAEAIQVHDTPTRDLAGEALREIQRRRKAADQERREVVKPIKDHAKALDQRFKDAMAPYEEADRILRTKVDDYEAEQEHIRKAEEARLEAERLERERLAREAREKQEAEERAKREQAEKEAREAAEEVNAAQDEEDRKAAEKLAEEARQKAEEAKTAESAIASLPDVQLPKAVVPAAPKLDGVVNQKRWDFEVTDLAAVPDHLPDGTPLKEVVSGALRRYMHAVIKDTGAPPEMPGVRFEQVRSQAVRG